MQSSLSCVYITREAEGRWAMAGLRSHPMVFWFLYLEGKGYESKHVHTGGIRRNSNEVYHQNCHSSWHLENCFSSEYYYCHCHCEPILLVFANPYFLNHLCILDDGQRKSRVVLHQASCRRFVGLADFGNE